MSKKNKPIRTLVAVANSQQATEKTTQDKFKLTESLAITQKSSAGRISPQISCTVEPEDKLLLNEITLFAINKYGKLLNTSTILRALIRLGYKNKEELDF
jgi:hypothetical protein